MCKPVNFAGMAGHLRRNTQSAHFQGKDDGLVTVKPLLDRVERLEGFLDAAPDSGLEADL